MMPILQRIDEKLKTVAREDLRAELVAERISYMVRIGQFAESNELLRQLRRDFGDGRYPRVSVWLMIVDGLVGFFERLDSGSTDRLLRAHEIARAAGYSDLNRIAASWLVMNGFNTGNFEFMARYLKRYVEATGRESDTAACRVAVIVTYAQLYAGRFGHARVWFEFARHLAVEIGDEASIASIMYGRAAMHNARARLNKILNRDEPLAQEFATLEVESSESFHRATGQSSLSQALDLLRARLLISQEKYLEAASILKSLVDSKVSVSILGDQLILQVEHAVALLWAGFPANAREALESLNLADARKLGVDDQVVFWSYFEQIARGTAEGQLLARAQAEFSSALGLYQAEMELLNGILDGLEAPLLGAFAHVPGPRGAVAGAAPTDSSEVN